ncbi:MAG: LacI family DNA-binding transcriptional regulator [Paracoccaceae bacterium]
MADKSLESRGTINPAGGATSAHDVAVAAGVSRIMVSRAFNPDASIRADKRKHILHIAGELGYHPDMAARSMVTGRSNLVAILVPSIARSWESQEVDCLVEALQQQGMVPLLFRLPPENLGAADIVQVRAYKPAAVIAFIDWIAPSKLVSMFGDSSAIYPHFGDSLPEPITAQTIDRLHINQHAGIQSAVKLLVGTGRRRLVYVAGEHFGVSTGTMGANSDRDRFVALEAALKKHDLELVARLDGNFDYNTARQSVGNFVRHGGKADAYFAANDTSAFGVMDALRFDLGVKVPDECAVVGFDNIPEAGWRAYDLTTVGVPVKARVSALMRLLKARLADPTGPSRIETVTASLVVRTSV